MLEGELGCHLAGAVQRPTGEGRGLLLGEADHGVWLLWLWEVSVLTRSEVLSFPS